MKSLRYESLTSDIIGQAIKVYKKLGYGFLEKLYENALIIELENIGLHTDRQKRVKVLYEDVVIGTYIPDIIVNSRVIVELKISDFITQNNRQQLKNYLRASNLTVGIIICITPDGVTFAREEIS